MRKELNESDALCHDPKAGIARLIEIMRRLRDPQTGCPWDIEQSYETIAPYTIEEAYEVAEAVAEGDFDALEGELGDLLLQVIYYAQMGCEEGRFDFDSIANRISDKMIARHPHVFGVQSRDKTARQQVADWEAIKSTERGAVGALAGVAINLPALTRAEKLQKRAARVGFDWSDVAQVLDKIDEELKELLESDTPECQQEEFGDLIFTMVNVARHLGIDAEQALRIANRKFTKRFDYIETTLAQQGCSIADTSVDTLEKLWEKAKKNKT